MSHYGKLLRRLREERGLSQRQLATAADIAQQTLQVQEGAERCRLRRSFVPRLYAALNRAAPVSAEDAKVLFESAGLTEALTQYAGSEQFKTDLAFGATVAASKTPREAEARERFEDIIEELGPEPVLHALAAIALAAGMKPPAWIVHTPPRVEENRVVTEHFGVRPPPSKGRPTRRTAP
ncbi:MAG: helix-turn-helix transcriptional regulator [Phycisphaerales bacterium]|nr:helix-turn-helix transcriptional regulator [Phycisphaerales bacterium]